MAGVVAQGRGVHPKIVAEMLGCSQIGITLNLYNHMMQRGATVAMDAIVSQQ